MRKALERHGPGAIGFDWYTGWSAMGWKWLIGLAGAALVAEVIETGASYVIARKGGASRRASICAVIGGLAAVHQFCHIGKMAMIGGCSKVVQDIPPFMIGDGSPAETRTINKVGLERNGISEAAQSALRQAYKILFREGLTIPNALAKIESDLPALPEIQDLVKFVRGSERGISK